MVMNFAFAIALGSGGILLSLNHHTTPSEPHTTQPTLLTHLLTSFDRSGESMGAGSVVRTLAMVAGGVTALGDLGSVMRELDEGCLILEEILERIRGIPYHIPHAANTDDFANVQDEKKNGEDGAVLENVRGRIEFRNVWFCYPSRPDVFVLRGFDLTIEPGSTVGIVARVISSFFFFDSINLVDYLL
jgi:ABC-type multidrug transport system fused ATPase/permease subunit